MKNNLLTVFLFIAVVVFQNDSTAQYLWTKDPRNPVLTGGEIGAWNRHVLNAHVLFNEDSARYEMWFQATPGPFHSDVPWYVGFAISRDGTEWTAEPLPVMSSDSGTWDQMSIGRPYVIRENGQYKMWYAGWASITTPNHLGYATSPDGIHWTKYAGNPVMGPGTAFWEVGGPGGGNIMQHHGEYKLWYGGWNQSYDTVRIGYATSVNGITWQEDTIHNPILSPGGAGQWDRGNIGWPIVLKLETCYIMWYSSMQRTTAAWRAAGIAFSPDGVTSWKKYSANPVFTTTPGGWDQNYAELTSVVLRGDTLHGWYDGSDTPMQTDVFKIGHATSPLVFTAVRPKEDRAPQQFMLSQNYPNPFNPSTTIEYELQKSSMVRLSVFDVLGREVSILVTERKDAGRYSMHWDAERLPSGMYFSVLQAGQFRTTKKMILMK